jgi:integrase
LMKLTAANGRGKGVFRIVEFSNPSGGTAYRVTGWTLEGERIRQNFKTHLEAVTRKQELETQTANLETAGQTVFTRLNATEVNDAEGALSVLRTAGHDSLRQAAEFFIRNWRDPLKRIATVEAVRTFMAEKTAANRRRRHLDSLRQDLDRLVEKFGRKPVHELTKSDLLALIEAENRAPRTQNHIRDRFHNFLGWCVKNGYAPENRAALIEKKSVDAGEIVVLTNDLVKKLLEAAVGFKDGKLVPYIALATFCAIRPDELARLSWEQIDLKEKQVTITASAAKKRGRRVVDMPENCIPWLRAHATRRTPIRGANWRRDFESVKELCGFGSPALEDATEEEKKRKAGLKVWPQDVLRHTGISCHYRLHEDEGKTAAWAGNSPDMIHTHYRALVSAKDAAAFFEIVPDAKGRVAKGKKKSSKQKIVALNSVLASGSEASRTERESSNSKV